MALAFGCSVDELARRVPADEFTEWMAYWQLEPWGAWRDNWHHANLAALLYNINRGKSPAVQTSDFMYQDAEAQAKTAAQAFASRLENLARKQNG